MPPYIVKESGWGEFTILIAITFAFPNLDPVVVSHSLQLHPKDGNISQKDTEGREWVIGEVYDELEVISSFVFSQSLMDCAVSFPVPGFD